MNSKFFKRTYEHLILVHTLDRPDCIENFLKSLFFNLVEFNSKEIAKLLLLVDDGSTLKNIKSYKEKISKYNKKYKKHKLNIDIDIILKKEQLRLVDCVISKSGQNKNKVLKLFFRSNNKFGGIRGIQNISSILANICGGYSISKNINPIIHKLDDDMIFQVLFKKDSCLHIINYFDFFRHKAELLNEKNFRLIGSLYSIDGPSVLYDLTKGLNFLKDYFKNLDFNGELKPELTSNYFYKQFIDECGLIKFPILLKSDSQDMINKKINMLFFDLLNQKQRFNPGCLNSFLEEKSSEIKFKDIPNRTNYLSGGCVSYKLDDCYVPYPMIGNQQFIFSYLESQKGVVYKDYPIGHLKGNNRVSIIKEICCLDNDPINVKHGHFITKYFVHNIVKYKPIEKGRDLKIALDKTLDVIDELKNVISDLGKILIKKSMSGKNNEELKARLLNFLLELKDNFELIRKEWDFVPDSSTKLKIERYFKEYLDSFDDWSELNKIAKDCYKNIRI